MCLQLSIQGSVHNNRVTGPQERHLSNKQDADTYPAPVDNHNRWEQPQQQTKIGPEQSSYDLQKISMQKQNNLSK